MIKVHSSQIAGRSINDSFLLVQSPSLPFDGNSGWFLLVVIILFLPLFHIFVLDVSFSLELFLFVLIILLVLRARISNAFYLLYHVISNSYNVNLAIDSIAAAPNVAIETNIYIIFLWVPLVFVGLPPVCYDKRVVRSPRDFRSFARTKMSGYFGCLYFLVESVVELSQIKKFVISSNFILESLFELLLCLFELLILFEEIKMRQGSAYVWKSVRFHEGQEFECFHLEA